MPTVLQVLPALDSGGVERGTVEIVAALAADGWTPLVASAGGRLVSSVEAAGGRHIALPLNTKSPVQILRNIERLTRLIRAEKVSLVHARSRAPAWSAFFASRQTGVPFVTTYHGAYGEGGAGKRLYNSVMARGEKVIVASAFMAKLVHRRHGTGDDRLRLIPRGIDPAVFEPSAVGPVRVARVAAGWGIPEGVDVVLLPARLSRWKGQDVLIAAMGRLRRPDLRFVLLGGEAGREGYAETLRALAAKVGVGAQLVFAGHCDDMPAALLRATIVVSPSTEPEAFGRAVIEAQAMARLVIATNHGGAAETVRDGETGLLVPPGDPAALAEALARALDMPDSSRRAIGARARREVRERYTVAEMQRATLEVYEQILGGEHRT
jgi:glycosyltransferase involved in cell wall biosynthesis